MSAFRLKQGDFRYPMPRVIEKPPNGEPSSAPGDPPDTLRFTARRDFGGHFCFLQAAFALHRRRVARRQ